MKFNELKEFVFEMLEKELPSDLSYHGISHTKDWVLPKTKQLLDEENIQGEDETILLTSALLHDVGYIEKYENNEEIATKIAKELLPKYNYNDEQIEKICKIIMATKMPQNPKNIYEKIICDADLSNLGSKDFFKISKNYRLELSNYGYEYTDEEWIEIQINFLKSHKFFTKSAQKLWNKIQEENLEVYEKLIEN
jgi:HD superfamily phosphodiesterase